MRSGEPPIRVENVWLAIIDRETFQLVQKKMASRIPQVTHPRTIPSFYLLSGLLFCSCGGAMAGYSAKSKRHFYYLCSRSFKQDKDACDAKMLPKEKLERLVIEQLKSKVLTEENLEALVILVNEELQSASFGLKDRLDDLALRIKELKARKDELNKSRVQIEVEMVARGFEQVDVAIVKAYVQDLRGLLALIHKANRG